MTTKKHGGARPGSGRPPGKKTKKRADAGKSRGPYKKSTSAPKNEKIQIRVSEDEKNALETLSKLTGAPVATIVRLMASQSISRLEDVFCAPIDGRRKVVCQHCDKEMAVATTRVGAYDAICFKCGMEILNNPPEDG